MKARRVSDMSTAQLLRRAAAYKARRPSYTPSARIYARRDPNELKGVDVDIGTPVGTILATTNTNADAVVLNLVQAGNGSWNRVGKRIKLDSVRLRGKVTCDLSVTAVTGKIESNCVRMVVVYDAQPSSGSIPTFDTIFGRTVQDGTESTLFKDPLRYDNVDRFKVLRDKVMDFQATAVGNIAAAANAGESICSFDEYIKLGGLETVFSGQSAPMTIADISSGALYVFFRASEATAVCLASVSTNSFARLRYRD